jgi:hypothetical chaperone protein
MDVFCGIDFGTSNSVVSVLPAGKPDAGPDSLMEPTVVFFPNDRETTVNRFIGDAAIRSYLSHGLDGRFFQSFKALLPDRTFRSTKINGKDFKIEDLVAYVLRHLKTAMEERHGVTIRSAVLGRPARFSEDPEEDALAERRLEKAARQAGLTDVRFEFEPIAAAYAYERTIRRPELVLVGDFGGGTSDFTIMNLDPAVAADRDRSADIIGTSGVYIGGDAFDASILGLKLREYFGYGSTFESFGRHLPVPNHYYALLSQWSRLSLLKSMREREELKDILVSADDRPSVQRLVDLIEHDLGYPLSRSIESAKCRLSSAEAAAIDFASPYFSFRKDLSRAEFETAIAGQLDRIEACVADLLARTDVAPGRIASVFLTGGSSKIPCLIARFARLFPDSAIHSDSNQFISIARGLALKARSLS